MTRFSKQDIKYGLKILYLKYGKTELLWTNSTKHVPIRSKYLIKLLKETNFILGGEVLEDGDVYEKTHVIKIF